MNDIASSDRHQRAYEWVRVLAAIPARYAGSTSERRAAEHIAAWMRDLGLSDIALSAAPSRPRTGFSLALHAAVAGAGLFLGGFIGVILATLAAISFRTEQTSRKLILSRLLPSEASVNVIGRFGAATATRRVLLSAHIDTTQAGFLFRREVANLFARLQEFSSGPPTGPLALPHAVILAAAALTIAQWLGAHGALFGIAKLAGFTGIILNFLLPLQWALSPATPGANDNASAVASMLTCAEELLKDLPSDVELWVAGTGAEEVGHGGMIHALRPEWSKDSTYCVNFECTGGGNLHIIQTEGLLNKVYYPPIMLELARRIAASGKFGTITPVDLLAGTDGCIPAQEGYASLSLISLEANGVPRNYHRLEDTIEGIDADMLVRAGDFGAAVAKAALRGEAGALG